MRDPKKKKVTGKEIDQKDVESRKEQADEPVLERRTPGMVAIGSLDAHEYPPARLRQQYKAYRTLKVSDIDAHPAIIDPQRLAHDALPDAIFLDRWLAPESLSDAFDRFTGGCTSQQAPRTSVGPLPKMRYGTTALTVYRTGLEIIPSILPPQVQIQLLSKLLHRDLSDQRHQTNLHLHYNVTYPDASRLSRAIPNGHSPSFFEDTLDRAICPKDSSVHLPLTVQSILNRKLRWMTLGGQYNWTEKRYPAGEPPPFPSDISALLNAMFPATQPEAAIVNVYSPGDTLNIHRDVSEDCDTGLISISFGCEGLFMVGHADNSDLAVVRLRSGDAVYMGGASRVSWHAVPRIVPASCPDWLQDWPGDSGEDGNGRFQQWKGWMAGKRVNLNVRQMRPTTPVLSIPSGGK
ncbi:oxidoreductase [Arthroderma uncinatum]|uniref:oxidoreductase n=1 Tax=Arthroderma uncinatum TaxID=74035 RepID=UPI00144A91B9|nr:oxidoreductase [Arthroderma uncinatum]KAF3484355.1 oxidoreductase [Arthroderma uncinatum]